MVIGIWRGGSSLLMLSRAGGGAISLRRQKGHSSSCFPTQMNLKTSTRISSRVCFCTTSGSGSGLGLGPVSSSNIVVSDSEEDKLKGLGNSLDIRVGEIIKIWRHEEADSLYVEEVDVGEPEPRIICSGLVKYIPLEHLQNKKVVVLANLKPRNMRGVKSSGMLMAASDALHENVQLLVPPQGSLPGDRVWFGSQDDMDNLPDAASPNQIQKKKIWESVQPHLKSDDSCVAALGMHMMRTSAGVVETGSLKNANIS